MTRKRHPTIRTGDLPLPTGVTELPVKPVDPPPENRWPLREEIPPTQLDRANALARAREEGEREGVIAGMTEAAATCKCLEEGAVGSFGDGAGACRDEILTELHRRFPNDERVRHHLKMRGLE